MITKGNPYGSPLLGQAVDVKDYTTTPLALESKQAGADTPMPKKESVKETVSETVKESVNPDMPGDNLPPPPDDNSFGNDYEDDGIPEFKETPMSEEELLEEGGTGEGINLADIDNELFTEIVISNFQAYVPSLFVGLSDKISKVRKKDIIYHTGTGKIPKDFLELYEKSHKELVESLKITDEEARLLSKALEKYLETQKIQAASPGSVLIIQSAAIMLRLTITSITEGARQRDDWDAIFNKFGIKNPRQHDYFITVKDEK